MVNTVETLEKKACRTRLVVFKEQTIGSSYQNVSILNRGMRIAPHRASDRLKQTISRFDEVFRDWLVAIMEDIRKAFTVIIIGQ